MKKIEYYERDFAGQPPDYDDLDALSDDGWETFAVVYVPRTGDYDFWRAYLKRETK